MCANDVIERTQHTVCNAYCKSPVRRYDSSRSLSLRWMCANDAAKRTQHTVCNAYCIVLSFSVVRPCVCHVSVWLETNLPR